MTTTFERIRGLLSALRFNADEITEQSSFIDDLGADSLDLVEIVMGAEDEFDITIRDEEAELLLTVGDAVKFIDLRLSE